MTQTHITEASTTNRTANANDRRTPDTGDGIDDLSQSGGVMTARRDCHPRRWAAVALLLGGIVAAVGPGMGVGVLQANTCDGCSFGLMGDATVQARVVDADGPVDNVARVKDVDGVTSA